MNIHRTTHEYASKFAELELGLTFGDPKDRKLPPGAYYRITQAEKCSILQTFYRLWAFCHCLQNIDVCIDVYPDALRHWETHAAFLSINCRLDPLSTS